MAYGIWCTVMGAEVLFAETHWMLRVVGGFVTLAGMAMMAGGEKTAKKSQVTLLEIGRELLRRTRNEK